MRIEEALKRQLGQELCALVDDCSQTHAAAMLGIPQPKISALRRGRYEGFSVSRLIRLITTQHYNVEIHLKPIDRPYARPGKTPTLAVIRYDRFGRPVTSGESVS